VEKTVYLGALRSVLLTKYYSDDQIEKNEMGGAFSTRGKRSGAFRILVRKTDGNIPLGKPRLKWENNIKIHFK